MEYVKLYGDVLTHPKWQALSTRAKVALVQAWMYAGKHDTGGHIPDVAVRLLELTRPVAAELEEGRWLHRNGAGWLLHDWDHHQVDAEEARAERDRVRELNRDRKRRQRERERGEIT